MALAISLTRTTILSYPLHRVGAAVFRSMSILSTYPVARPTTTALVSSLPLEDVEQLYRPFLPPPLPFDADASQRDWVDDLELDDAMNLATRSADGPVRVLVLYGSLRERSFSKLTAYEAARILSKLGADVRIFNPEGLPIKDEPSEGNTKVLELRALSEWSQAMFWCSPEQHGTLTAVFKNQIDWIPLSMGSVRPTQGRTLAICQVNGGSQSFNTVSVLRNLGRWMRMWTIPNQSSIPMAWKAFSDDNRLMPSSNRDRLVDVCEELVRTTILLRPHKAMLEDRYSERQEKMAHGRLRTQKETEHAKDATAAAAETTVAVNLP